MTWLAARVVAVLSVGVLAAIAGTTPAAATTDPVSRQLSIVLPSRPMLTLPAGDGFRDRVQAEVTAPTRRPVDVLAVLGRTVVRVAAGVVPATTQTGDVATVTVGVSGLSAGAWRLVAVQDGVTAAAGDPLVVGSGVPRKASLELLSPVAHPSAGRAGSAVRGRVVARDETGVVLPVRVVMTVERSHSRRAADQRRPRRAPVLDVPTAGLANGVATVTAVLRGPAGAAVRLEPRTVQLAPTVITHVSVGVSSPVVEPVVDDRLDSVDIVAGAISNADGPVPVHGRIVVLRDGRVVRSWALTSSARRTVVWDGRIGGRIVPGDYTVRVSERGPSGATRAADRPVRVSSAHLPQRVRTVAPLGGGNLQGLAITDTGGSAVAKVWTTVADRGGMARIDEYDLAGKPLAVSPPLPLGHAAGIAAGPDGTLAVINGGPTAPTRITIVDPRRWTIERTIDLGFLGPNGLIAAQPDGGWEVLSGRADAYALTLVDSDGRVSASAPVVVTGAPQGLADIAGSVWLYTSLRDGNLITRFDPESGAVRGRIPLAVPGEGEGLAQDPRTGAVYLGAHSPDRFGVLRPVTAH